MLPFAFFKVLLRNKIIIHAYTPASKASVKLANLTERKNLHTDSYGVKEFVCLSVLWSVRLSV